MPSLPQHEDLLIEPIYSQTSPGELIELGEIAVQFAHDGTTYAETARALLKFLPSDRLSFVIPTKEENTSFGLGLALDGWEGDLFLGDTGIPIKAYCGLVGKKYGGIVLFPNNSYVPITPDVTNIESAIFHLFNLPEFRGPDDYVLKFGEPPVRGGMHCGCVNLEADGWMIKISAIRETHELTKQLDVQGGYVITHVGRIIRSDERLFSSRDLEDTLSCLQHFLSFSTGRWAGVSLPIGYDSEGVAIFRRWGMMITAGGPWSGSCSWFDYRHSELLKEVFPGFYTLWKSTLWRRPLTEALYWYFGANDRGTGIGVDTGLILAQTALELLAWTHCVQERKMVSPTAFKRGGLSAADKLRLLASSIGIPVEIPAKLSALHDKPGKKWKDGMHALTDIRNTLVHPDATVQLSEGSYYDAWRLALWYIDLTLLRLCNYNGKYANRLSARFAGTVENVPWASNQTDCSVTVGKGGN